MSDLINLAVVGAISGGLLMLGQGVCRAYGTPDLPELGPASNVSLKATPLYDAVVKLGRYKQLDSRTYSELVTLCAELGHLAGVPVGRVEVMARTARAMDRARRNVKQRLCSLNERVVGFARGQPGILDEFQEVAYELMGVCDALLEAHYQRF
jgi:hypothetical protein